VLVRSRRLPSEASDSGSILPSWPNSAI
jgi:hypothetical protein